MEKKQLILPFSLFTVRLLGVILGIFFGAVEIKAQHNLQFYVDTALKNSPSLRENSNLLRINDIAVDLNEAQHNAPQISLTSNYLFAPYLNNNGNILSANPGPNAIGYDAGITNGGLYSAQINVEKNILNSGIFTAVRRQTQIQRMIYTFFNEIEKRNIQKQITDQYLAAYRSLLLYNISREILHNVQDQMALTGRLVEQGFVKSQNYILLRIEVQTEQIALNESFQQYKTDLLQLNALSGLRDTQTVFIDSVKLVMNENHPEFNFLQKYDIDSAAAVNQQELFESKYHPQVKLFLNTGLNAVELTGIQRKFGLSAGIDFQFPLFDGGQRDLTRQQNELTVNSIQTYKQFALSGIEMQRQTSRSHILLLQKTINDIDAQLIDYQNLIELSRNQVRTGDLSMIEYLTLLKNFIDVRKSKIEKEIALQQEVNTYNYWNE